LSEIWNKYGTKNGSETIEGAESRLGVTRDDYVGFYIVKNVIYLPPDKWATDEEIGFAKDIQIGKKYFNEEPLDIEIKDDLYLLDIIPSKEEKMLDKLIREETKEELEKSIKNLTVEDNIIICGLYGIKTKKITQKRLAK
jgi:hypothetical protein